MSTRVAICQFNPTVGAVYENANRILSYAKDAAKRGAKLMVVPELGICGYPPQDILFREELLNQVENALSWLSRESTIAILVGAPVRRPASAGFPLWNGAVLCQKGRTEIVGRKTLLPNYDVFNERRYFEPAKSEDSDNCFDFDGTRFGVAICEDAWNDDQFWSVRRYPIDPVQRLVESGAQTIICIAASPFSLEKPQFRERMFGHIAKRHKTALLLAAQVGANDQLVFDGGSMAFDDQGQAQLRCALFEEALVCVDLDQGGRLVGNENQKGEFPGRLEQMADALCLGIRDYIKKCQAPGVILGLSGGIDSAVTAALAARALGPEKVIGLRLPSQFSSTHSLEDAEALANNLGITLHTLPIEPAVVSFRQMLSSNIGSQNGSLDIVDQNLQARARGIVLMAMSNRFGHLLMATGNKSEMAVGYMTIYGDMCGAIAPLGDVYKTDIWALARHLSSIGFVIPKRTIEKIPSAELKPNQADQDTLPSYAQLDQILEAYIDREEPVDQIIATEVLPRSEIERVLKMVHASDYKRKQSALVLKVSEKVFGVARQWPVAKNFNPWAKAAR